MAGKTSGLLADTPEPDQEPYIPDGSVEEVIQTFQVFLMQYSGHGLPTVSHWNGLKSLTIVWE